MATDPFQAYQAAFAAKEPNGGDPLTASDLDELIDRGRASWPALSVDESAFAAALGDLLGAGTATEKLDPGELWLAVGCASGSGAAMRAFEDKYLSEVERSIGHMRLDPDMLAEALQVTRRRLLVSTEGQPKIVGYAGRGQIRTLVRVVATRAALDLLRGQGRRREVSDADLSAVLLASTNPESAVGLGRKADLFQQAFEGAISDLEPADRTLLRLYVVDGVGLDGLATALGIHRSTAARRLAKIRGAIEEATRKRLAAGGLEGTQLESVIGVVDNGLELTLSRILADPAAKAER